MKLPKLFIGGHREIKRPVLSGDEALLQRMEQARRELRAHGKDVKAVIVPKAIVAPPPPPRLTASTPVGTRVQRHSIERSAPIERIASAPADKKRVNHTVKRPAPREFMDDSFAELDAVVVAMKRALNS